MELCPCHIAALALTADLTVGVCLSIHFEESMPVSPDATAGYCGRNGLPPVYSSQSCDSQESCRRRWVCGRRIQASFESERWTGGSDGHQLKQQGYCFEIEWPEGPQMFLIVDDVGIVYLAFAPGCSCIWQELLRPSPAADLKYACF